MRQDLRIEAGAARTRHFTPIYFLGGSKILTLERNVVIKVRVTAEVV